MPQFHRISEVSDLMIWKEWLHWPGFAIRVDGSEGTGGRGRLTCRGLLVRRSVGMGLAGRILASTCEGRGLLRRWGSGRVAVVRRLAGG